MDWDLFGPMLEQEAEVYTPIFEQAAEWLRRQLAPTRILDVGSGPGVITTLFAKVFPTAEVTAVDSTEGLLRRADDRAARLGVGDRVGTHVADLSEGLSGGLAAAGPADLVWSSKALHHLGDQTAAVRTLVGLLRPGGMLAVSEGGLPARRLPRDLGIGRPGLEARLDVANEDWFSEMRTTLPDHRAEAEDWPAMLAAAGLETVGSRTFLLDLPAPLSPEVREFLCSALDRQREMLGDRLPAEDLETLDRLLDPHDEAGLRKRPDVFLLKAQTVHVARLAHS